jgi:hypothetical protein
VRAKTLFFNPNKKALRTVGVARSAKGSLIPVWIDNWDFYVEVQPYRFHGTVSRLTFNKRWRNSTTCHARLVHFKKALHWTRQTTAIKRGIHGKKSAQLWKCGGDLKCLYNQHVEERAEPYSKSRFSMLYQLKFHDGHSQIWRKWGRLEDFMPNLGNSCHS